VDNRGADVPSHPWWWSQQKKKRQSKSGASEEGDVESLDPDAIESDDDDDAPAYELHGLNEAIQQHFNVPESKSAGPKIETASKDQLGSFFLPSNGPVTNMARRPMGSFVDVDPGSIPLLLDKFPENGGEFLRQLLNLPGDLFSGGNVLVAFLSQWTPPLK
jgi:hypothetical protein